jgi:MbtH protein
MFEDDTDVVYRVVRNDEDQYSIWPADHPVPSGWHPEAAGTKAECLALIRDLWTDMRPRSVRDAHDGRSLT